MLRLLSGPTIIGVILVAASAAAWAADPERRDTDSAAMRSRDAVEQARRFGEDAQVNREFRKQDELAISAAKRTGRDAAANSVLKDLPDIDTETLIKAQKDIRALLSSPQLNLRQHAFSNEGHPPPLVFISLSIPEDSLRPLLGDAARMGSRLVLRGLVENSMQRTVERLGELLGGGRLGGTATDHPLPPFAIDPTLFERFGVDKVPAFVLPANAPAPCTPSDCPVPDHLKLAGDVSLAYALGVMAREADGTPLGRRAELWRRRLEPPP